EKARLSIRISPALPMPGHVNLICARRVDCSGAGSRSMFGFSFSGMLRHIAQQNHAAYTRDRLSHRHPIIGQTAIGLEGVNRCGLRSYYGARSTLPTLMPIACAGAL